LLDKDINVELIGLVRRNGFGLLAKSFNSLRNFNLSDVILRLVDLLLGCVGIVFLSVNSVS
jgi:hypothetical protein